jgi:hypothetical protein
MSHWTLFLFFPIGSLFLISHWTLLLFFPIGSLFLMSHWTLFLFFPIGSLFWMSHWTLLLFCRSQERSLRQQSELEDVHVANIDLKQRLEILGEQTKRKISMVSREHRSLHEGSSSVPVPFSSVRSFVSNCFVGFNPLYVFHTKGKERPMHAAHHNTCLYTYIYIYTPSTHSLHCVAIHVPLKFIITKTNVN